MDLKKTGELIAESRRALGMTQKQLADAIGVTDKAISRWETGRGFPDAVYLQPLSQTLGISITEIVNGELTQPENAARQADDALLSALAYGRRMRRSVAAAVLALVGVALSLSPMYVLGANVEIGLIKGLRHIAFSDFEKIYSFKMEDYALEDLTYITEKYLLSKLQRNFKTLDFYKEITK